MTDSEKNALHLLDVEIAGIHAAGGRLRQLALTVPNRKDMIETVVITLESAAGVLRAISALIKHDGAVRAFAKGAGQR